MWTGLLVVAGVLVVGVVGLIASEAIRYPMRSEHFSERDGRHLGLHWDRYERF